MNPKEVRQLWVKSLKSGEYQQTHHALRREDNGEVRYCCLGVLCDLAVKHGVIRQFPYNSIGLTDEVRHWAGIKDYMGGYQTASLMRLNDGDKLPFPEIADVIEQEPEGLVNA